MGGPYVPARLAGSPLPRDANGEFSPRSGSRASWPDSRRAPDIPGKVFLTRTSLRRSRQENGGEDEATKAEERESDVGLPGKQCGDPAEPGDMPG
jgi:hypothetical protein